jgi:uncharacterized protein YggE
VPDQATMQYELTGHYQEYSDTVDALAKASRLLKDELEKAGFDRSKVENNHFSIDIHYTEKKLEDGTTKTVADGYDFNLKEHLDLPLDSAIIEKAISIKPILGSLPDVALSYSLKDEKAIEEKALQGALEDSQRKAEVIAKAMGIQLKGIHTIDYGGCEIHIHPYYNFENLVGTLCAPQMEINPSHQKFEQTVAVVWDIQ